VIVTAEHALRRDEEIQVTLPDGRAVPAVLGGRDPQTDLAVLKCAEAGAGLPEFGDVALLKPGSITLVVGRTRASGPVAALGVVSLVAPERRTWMGVALAPYIRLDVGLQPTAVGGVVIDAQGRANGVATTKFARFGAIAIPAHTVSAVVDTLLEKGRIPRGYLGVGLQPVRLPEALRQSLGRNEKTAAIVLDVEPRGPAHKAGMVIGEILVSLGGRQVAQLEDIQSQLHGEAIGKPVAVKFIRGGGIQEVTILIGERIDRGE
jgi:S1-C subfamily serine protease